MTKERVIEMAKGIYNMHGLAESREQQKFFFDGKIFFYNMEHIVKNSDFFKADLHIIRVRVSKNTVYCIKLYNDKVGDIYGRKYDRHSRIKLDDNIFPMPIKRAYL